MKTHIDAVTQLPDAEPVYFEINCAKLPKRALNILKKYDAYIGFMSQRASRPDAIKIYPRDYEFLAEKLMEAGHNILTAAYRGYRLERYAE